jgi:hypothetical protein
MTTRQRIEGNLNRTFALELVKRADTPADDGAADGAQQDNVVLTFSFSSETPYMRSNYWDDPWLEILGHDDGECDLSRLMDGAPVLANHSRWGSTPDSPLSLIGATTKAWIENKRGMVEVKLSRREGMEGLLQDLADGIVRNVSVGYQILERTLIKQVEGMPDEYRVTKWLPMEVSLVDIPADATVGLERSVEQTAEGTRYRVIDLPDPGFSTKGSNMGQAAQNAAPGSEVQPDIEAVRREATEAERTRSNNIRLAVRSANLEDAYAEELITSGVQIDAAREAVLTKLAERSKTQGISSRADIVTVRDETETRREMMGAALLHRSDSKNALPDGAREYRGLSLLDMARDCLEVSGVKTRGLDRTEIARRSFETTSDLPYVLANVANKSLRQAYMSAPRTFTPWARKATAPDFKQMSRVALSDAPALDNVPEGGEFKRGAFSDGKEVYQLATYGKIVPISRQSIINDDLQAFTRLPGLMAMSAANLESDTVYGIVTANAALADGVALFHATHANLAGAGAVISVASLGAGRGAMRVQKSPQNVVLNLGPQYLIVPAALETIANQFTSADFVSAKSSDINPFKGSLEVIVEGRLDANSATAWYLAANYNQVDTVEYSYLEGQEGAYLETRQGFDIDGWEFKVRLDFAAKGIDYRGLYKNPGA